MGCGAEAAELPNKAVAFDAFVIRVDGGKNAIRASVEVLPSSSAIEAVYPVP